MKRNNARRPRVLFLAVLLSAAVLDGIAGRAWPADTASPAEESHESVLGMKFVLIPVGEFWMGTPTDQFGDLRQVFSKLKSEEFSRETPRHSVRITKPFWLAVHEVTVGQFRTFVDATAYRTDAERNQNASGWNRNSQTFDYHAYYNWRNPGFEQADDHPVVNVSWNDAQEFCSWLSRLEKRTYRLPTEAEWEYACRAGAATWFSHGNDPEGLVAIGNVADRSARGLWGAAAGNWTFVNADDGYPFTCPVGRFQANAWGLYDMHGNAWEWCQDRYGSGYYAASPADDPPGPTRGDQRVCRGGSWGTYAWRCRAAYRNRGDSGDSERFIGFRLALDPEIP